MLDCADLANVYSFGAFDDYKNDHLSGSTKPSSLVAFEHKSMLLFLLCGTTTKMQTHFCSNFSATTHVRPHTNVAWYMQWIGSTSPDIVPIYFWICSVQCKNMNSMCLFVCIFFLLCSHRFHFFIVVAGCALCNYYYLFLLHTIDSLFLYSYSICHSFNKRPSLFVLCLFFREHRFSSIPFFHVFMAFCNDDDDDLMMTSMMQMNERRKLCETHIRKEKNKIEYT